MNERTTARFFSVPRAASARHWPQSSSSSSQPLPRSSSSSFAVPEVPFYVHIMRSNSTHTHTRHAARARPSVRPFSAARHTHSTHTTHTLIRRRRLSRVLVVVGVALSLPPLLEVPLCAAKPREGKAKPCQRRARDPKGNFAVAGLCCCCSPIPSYCLEKERERGERPGERERQIPALSVHMEQHSLHDALTSI